MVFAENYFLPYEISYKYNFELLIRNQLQVVGDD